MASVNPTVSLILPVYNAAPVIGRTITSVLQQTLSDVELLVVDDGSTDQLAAVLQIFAGAPISLLRQERAGLPRAMNRALAQARGAYITWSTAGDALLPSYLADLHNLLQARGTCGAAYTDYLLVDADGNPLTAAGYDFKGQSGLRPALFLRRQTVEQVGPFAEQKGEEAVADYVYRLQKNVNLCRLPRVLYLHRRPAGLLDGGVLNGGP